MLANGLSPTVAEVKLIGESNHGSIAGIGNAMNEAIAQASDETCRRRLSGDDESAHWMRGRIHDA